MRYLGALFVGAPDLTLAEINTSIKSYLLTKSPLTRPLPQNIQALALLALRIEDRACGIWLATAIRMACILGWNHSVELPIASAPLSTTEFLWWALMCEDIWLSLVFTGTPNLIWPGDCNVRNPSSPSFFCDIVALSNIARHILRPETVDATMRQSASQDFLAAWEATHQGIASNPIPEAPIPQRAATDDLLASELSSESSQWMPVAPSNEASPQTIPLPESSRPMNMTLTPTALIRLVYAAVVGLLVLDPFEPYNRDPHLFIDSQREAILHMALILESRFQHGAFARWRLLVKLADIAGAALCVLGMDRGREWAAKKGNGAADIRTLEDLWAWWGSGDEEAFQKESGSINAQPYTGTPGDIQDIGA
ncbi:hypothetical protein V1509DRAFT_559242 [Lipomyces kononenkoae]